MSLLVASVTLLAILLTACSDESAPSPEPWVENRARLDSQSPGPFDAAIAPGSDLEDTVHGDESCRNRLLG